MKDMVEWLRYMGRDPSPDDQKQEWTSWIA